MGQARVVCDTPLISVSCRGALDWSRAGGVADPGGRMYAPRVVAGSPVVGLTVPEGSAISPTANRALEPEPSEQRVSPTPPGAGEGGPPSHPPILPESPVGSLLWRVRGMVLTVRPHQWVTNLFVL